MSEIDFTEKLPATAELLSTPKATDTLEEIRDKMKKLATIVEQGKSLAIHTGHPNTISNISNTPTENINTLAPLQFSHYKAYVDVAAMPTIDWQNSSSPIPRDADSHFYQQVDAIREIFRNPQLSPENASWFLSNHSQEIPLVDAVVKVRIAQPISGVDERELTSMELAELQTIREILSVSNDRVQQVTREARQLSKNLNESLEILRAHVRATRAKAVHRNEEEIAVRKRIKIEDEEAVETKESVKMKDEGSVDEMKDMPII